MEIKYEIQDNNNNILSQALEDYKNLISSLLNKGRFTLDIFENLEKEFNTVDHKIPQKIEHYGPISLKAHILSQHNIST